jgi:hypothetical protein
MNQNLVCSDCGSDDVTRCAGTCYVYCNLCDAVVIANVQEDEE